MTEPQTPNASPLPRPWRRLHRSTYVVLAVLLAVLVLANVPGQLVRSPSLSEGWHGFDFMLEDELQHGWPATYLWREPSDLPIPWAMPPAGWRSLWPLTENVKRWNRASLAIDVFVGLAVLALGGAGYEAWRRRRTKLWQLHLSDLLALVAVASLVLGYWKIHADEYRSQHEALVAIQGESYENDWQPGGPSWLRLLLEDRRFHILDRAISITVHTNEPGQLQYLARLSYLKRIESASEEILPYLGYHPQLEVLKLDMRDAEHGQWAALRQVSNLRALKLAETGIADADLIHLAGLKRLQNLNLSDNAITDQGLVHLAGLTGLETLSLAGTKVTDAGLVHLKGLTNLRDLSLNYLVTPPGVEQLAALPNLERLWLPSKIDGDAIRHFRRLRKLQYLKIKDPDLTDEHLTPLAEMIGLESLTIEGDRFTGRGLVALRSLNRLEHLSLSGDSLTDVGLIHLGGLQKLQAISLKSPRLTDACLAPLAPLGRLESLTIQEGRITGKGIEHLKTLGSLTTLTLNDTETTDQDLLPLGELSALEDLKLQNVPLTDASLAILVRLPRLIGLVLENTEVTDAGLLRLAACQQLESLTVKGRHITTEGLDKLLQQLPNYRQLGK